MFLSKKRPENERRSRVPQTPSRERPVFSYHANRSIREGANQRDIDYQQQPKIRRNLRSWRSYTANIAIILAVLVVTICFMQLSNKATVQSVGTPSGELFLRDKAVYTAAVQQAFSSPINRNKLTVNTGKISNDLKKQFPELKAVSVSLPAIGTRPTVYIQPSIPSMILVSRDGMYVLDTDGRALIAGNQVAKLSDLGVPAVNDESGLAIRAGEIALPKSVVVFTTEVVGQLKAKQVGIGSLTLPMGTNELHVRPDKAGYYVKFNLHGNAREEVGAFLATKQYLEGQKKLPRSYIDVRVENKVYYQ
ncbi:MAG TPA: hypothetical protein VF733_01285 [Candidatus Saccharimonadales bacterium]